MSKKASARTVISTHNRRRAGRPLRYDLATCLAVYRYIEEQKERTGYSVNKICKRGSFAWIESGAPEWCPGGPRQPMKEHEITGRTLHRAYYQAVQFLNSGISVPSRPWGVDSVDVPLICGAEPEWAMGWMEPSSPETLIKSIEAIFERISAQRTCEHYSVSETTETDHDSDKNQESPVTGAP
jgi:hypothetical protein